MQTRSSLGVAAALADEVAVVEDVVVDERRALGEAGRAARVLDVDRVVELELGGALAQRVRVDAAAPASSSSQSGVVEEDDALERGQRRRAPRRPSRRSRSS